MKKLIRQYQPIWNTVKEQREVFIACSETNFERIKKAVIKEKDMDVGYKELGKRYLSFKFFVNDEEHGTGIRFRLHYSANPKLFIPSLQDCPDSMFLQ